MSPISEDDLRAILALLDDESASELRIVSGGLSIHIVREGGAVPPAGGSDPAGSPSSSRTSASGSGPERSEDGAAATSAVPAGGGTPSPSMPSGAAAPTPASSAKPGTGSGVAVEAPMLGVWYVAEAPGKPPFVSVGDHVEPDTVVGIVEVMKMMNSVEAGVSGTVTEICVGNAEMVEEGQPLLMVEPS